MSAIDQFTDEQRQIIIREIARHRKEAEAIGYAKGRGDGQAISVADWIRAARKSWVVGGGAAAIAVGITAMLDIWPVVAEQLAGKVDPLWLAIGGVVAIALRGHSLGKGAK
jgi:hypothetical protein